MGVLVYAKMQIRKWHMKYQNRRLMKYELGGGTDAEVNLLLLAHSLEKGMGIPSPRPGFGYEKAKCLCTKLEEYIANGNDRSRFAFREGVSVLDAYIQYTDNDCSEFKDSFDKIKNTVKSSCSAGIKSCDAMSEIYRLLDKEQIEYFISSRHSIRSFEDKPVDETVLRDAIEMAIHAPSACNRQPEKIYFTSDHIKSDQIKMLIPGNKGFENEIFNWAIITEDRCLFGLNEPLQWYVNGGIFLAYFVQSLHAYGIGSCIFQIPATHENTPKLRALLSIPEREAIIAAVGLGYPEEKNKFLAAERRPVDEVLVKF